MKIVAGLSSAEAARRLTQFGANKLPETGTVPGWRRLLAELTHFFALLLWVAGALAFLAGMPQLAVAIVVVVVVNGVFAFVQEHRAEQAAPRLRDLLPAGHGAPRRRASRQVDASRAGRRRRSCCSPPATGSRPTSGCRRGRGLLRSTSRC